jgi:hypothetical protein
VPVRSLTKDNKEEKDLVDVAPRVGVNHVHVVFLCFVRCIDVFIC